MLFCVAQLLIVHSDCHQGAPVTREREGRSLVNSFPFTEARPVKQSQDQPEVNFKSVAAASASGQKCIDKVSKIMVMMERIMISYKL